jgi:hypothetical protein
VVDEYFFFLSLLHYRERASIRTEENGEKKNRAFSLADSKSV